MPTVTLTPSAIGTNTSYASITSNYPLTNLIGSGSSASKYAGINLKTGGYAESWFYVRFDCSDIPENVTINSITCTVKAHNSSNAISRTSTRDLTLYSGGHDGSARADGNYKQLTETTGITASGSNTYTLNQNTSVTISRSDLDNLCLEAFYIRNNTQSTTSTQVYLMGANVIIDYTENTDVGPSSGGDFSYTGQREAVTLEAGTYKLQCWGAQGGNYGDYKGGKGGYSEGTLVLTETTTLYVYVGGQPATVSTSRAKVSGGFNGGGNGQNRYYSSTYTYGQGGGGASDIRIGTDDLYHRVIVAGGGAGSASDNSTTKWGGGETGGPGGASASASYVAGLEAPTSSGYYVAGTFGQGASAYTSRTDYQCGSGGGGGGWYGGYAYNYAQDSQTALRSYCGGGSGFVWKEDLSWTQPPGNWGLSFKYYLSNAFTVGGNTAFESVSGGSETGHEGNGYVRISSAERDPWYEIDTTEGESGTRLVNVTIYSTSRNVDRNHTFTVTTAHGTTRTFEIIRKGKE